MPLMIQQSMCARDNRRRRAAGFVAAGLLVALLLLLTPLLAGCGDGPGPEQTMSALGAELGDAKLDETDFAALLPVYTTAAYVTNSQPEQADYQLFLAGKAADEAFNQGDAGKVTVTQDVSGDKATMEFSLANAEGVFSVADLSTITVTLVKTGAQPYPWQIEAIALTR